MATKKKYDLGVDFFLMYVCTQIKEAVSLPSDIVVVF